MHRGIKTDGYIVYSLSVFITALIICLDGFLCYLALVAIPAEADGAMDNPACSVDSRASAGLHGFAAIFYR